MSHPPSRGLQAALRNRRTARAIVEQIHQLASGLGEVRLMEVCGTHTVAIRRAGIPSMLPDSVQLFSGPGCPVCVTPNAVIDRALAMARLPGVTITTFGDMLQVPGSRSSLARERAAGAQVQVVYSALDAVAQAARQPDRQVVLLGVGFETTAPTVAAAVRHAATTVTNFSVLVAHKLVPPAMEALVSLPDFAVDGFILPGHVSAIIGSDAYLDLARQHGKACVVAGFEPVDVLLAIRMLLEQLGRAEPGVEVEYARVVRPAGNRQAKTLLDEVFAPTDSEWRGLGSIPGSGLALRPAYENIDAQARIAVEVEPPVEPAGCLCGQVLSGAARPTDCGLFGKACQPEHPVGPCMVSAEGTCAAYHRWGT